MRYLAKIIICHLALAAALLVEPGHAQENDLSGKITKKENELQDLRSQIEQQRKKIKDLEKREKNESEYLKKLREEAALTGKLLDGLEEKKAMLEESSESLRVDLEMNEQIYWQRREVLSRRLREIYKNGPRHTWAEILEAENFADLLQRYKFISLIAERDADLVEDVRKRREEIREQESQITQVLFEVSISSKEKREELGKLRQNEKKQKDIVGKIQSDKKGYEKKVAELAEAEKKMQNFIEELEKARIEQAQAWGEYGEKDFASLKGRLSRPVTGNIVKRFGRFKHPEFGTVTYNTGIDIETRPGEPVLAVGRGRVDFSGVLPGYGNCIILNHGDGYYTLYAHIAEIFARQGTQVERGGLIAETLGPGDVAKSALHFEIRKSKKALDPGEWLEKGGK
ncbi:MAG: peptidoglycan DD-metalloendopeptidase family protein [Candidatus Krumholzibacteriota bacterium]|nr:peptidoglycan DD-metalloendopeptidase family protein [Candidatus Krumholzibacteriota bacterium]